MISIELVEKGVLVNPTLSDALYQLHSINPGLCDKIVQELPRIVILKGDQAND